MALYNVEFKELSFILYSKGVFCIVPWVTYEIEKLERKPLVNVTGFNYKPIN